MVYDRKKGNRMTCKTDIIYIISTLIGAITLIGAVGFNQYIQLKSIERNIESAIVKGIDPVAVRCAYKADSSMCAIYAVKTK